MLHMLPLVLLYERYTSRPSGESLDQMIRLSRQLKSSIVCPEKKLFPGSHVAKSCGRQVKSLFALREAVFGKPVLILT